MAVRIVDGTRGTERDRAKRFLEVNDPRDNLCVLLSKDTYTWDEWRTMLQLRNKYSTMIIEAGRRADRPTLEDFEKAILANPLKLQQTVVQDNYVLRYRGCGASARKIVYNAGAPAIPAIGGVYVNYSLAKVFDTPLIQSQYSSGVVTLRSISSKRVLDFNKFAPNNRK